MEPILKMVGSLRQISQISQILSERNFDRILLRISVAQRFSYMNVFGSFLHGYTKIFER